MDAKRYEARTLSRELGQVARQIQRLELRRGEMMYPADRAEITEEIRSLYRSRDAIRDTLNKLRGY